MSHPQIPRPAKLVVGVFMKDQSLFTAVVDDLVHDYGELDLVSCWIPFDYTRYYEPEMGTPLFRRLMAFKQLIQQDALVEIKWHTNSIEQKLMAGTKRRVNIDPGYLLLERFVLATGKNFSHRIYLHKGIFADLTLIYQKGRYRALSWTYPDYQQSAILDFLNNVRLKYALDLKQDTRK